MARISLKQKNDIDKKIIQVATTSFLEKGYKQTSTKTIAQAVGIAEGTLFNYYKTKATLLVAVLEKQSVVKQVEFSEESAIHQCLYLSKNAMEYIIKLPKMLINELLQVLLNNQMDGSSIEALIALDLRFIEELNQLMIHLIETSKLKEVDTKLLAEAAYADMMFCMFLYIYDPEMKPKDFYNKLEQKYKFTLSPYIGETDVQ
jgi:AcrR family transcriptional regulator